MGRPDYFGHFDAVVWYFPGTGIQGFFLVSAIGLGNLIYDRNQKAYFPSDTFAPCFMGLIENAA